MVRDTEQMPGGRTGTSLTGNLNPGDSLSVRPDMVQVNAVTDGYVPNGQGDTPNPLSAPDAQTAAKWVALLQQSRAYEDPALMAQIRRQGLERGLQNQRRMTEIADEKKKSDRNMNLAFAAIGGMSGIGAGVEETAGTTTGASAGSSSGGGGMFDDFTGDWADSGGDVGGGYNPGDYGGVDEFGNPTQGNFEGGPGTPGSGDYYNPGAGAPSGGLPNLPPGSSTVVGRLLGGSQPKPPTRPGTNTTSGNSGAVNGVVSGVAGALIGNNLTGGGGFASRNDAASGNFDNEAALANQLWQTYQQQYSGPGGITTQAINDARNIDSPENQARVMGAAHADSAQATNAASQAAIERLRQYGVNPSSDRLASLNAQIQASGAASDAGSQTMARQHLVDAGITARQNMAQLGNSLPTAAMTGLYSAGTGNAKLGSTTFDQADKIGTGVGKMIQPIAGGISDWLSGNGGVSGVANKVSGGISDWLNGNNGSIPRSGVSGGFLAGEGGTLTSDGRPREMPMPATYSGGNVGYRRGGLVRGAGTGTSDSVPAVGANKEPIRLSNGEYIIPADVVRHKGVEFFDRIVGKIHQPVGVRRA